MRRAIRFTHMRAGKVRRSGCIINNMMHHAIHRLLQGKGEVQWQSEGESNHGEKEGVEDLQEGWQSPSFSFLPLCLLLFLFCLGEFIC